MQLLINKSDQISYTAKQLDGLFPFQVGQTEVVLARCIDLVYDRLEYCFSRILNKYYKKDGEVYFSPLITDQYAVFLYFLARTVATEIQNREMADRVYALNKALHGIDVYYEVKLPDIFLLIHTVGTVLGRAQYSDYLVVYHGVTVGGNLELEYPVIGEGVGLFANCTVIGRSVIGSESMIAAGSLLINQRVPDRNVCFGMYPDNKYKRLKKSVKRSCFESAT